MNPTSNSLAADLKVVVVGARLCNDECTEANGGQLVGVVEDVVVLIVPGQHHNCHLTSEENINSPIKLLLKINRYQSELTCKVSCMHDLVRTERELRTLDLAIVSNLWNFSSPWQILTRCQTIRLKGKRRGPKKTIQNIHSQICLPLLPYKSPCNRE